MVRGVCLYLSSVKTKPCLLLVYNLWSELKVSRCIKVYIRSSARILSPLNVGISFDSFGFHPIDDTENAPALFSFRDNDFHSICCSAVNGAHLRNVLDGVEYIDRESVFYEKNKAVSAWSAIAFFFAISMSVSSLPVQRTSAIPEDSQKPNPNFICGLFVRWLHDVFYRFINAIVRGWNLYSQACQFL